jgi:quercetin dioxygenase-like cupin family protein
MRAAVGILFLSLTLSVVSVSAGQTSRDQSATQLPAEADPGVRPFRLMDRDEIRVTRVELQPGAIRRVHVHDDVEYHVWTPMVGTLEITIGNDAPKAAAPGQAFFMKRGTPHGFRNTGTTPAAVLEIFVKKSTTAAAAGADLDLTQLLTDAGVSVGR